MTVSAESSRAPVVTVNITPSDENGQGEAHRCMGNLRRVLKQSENQITLLQRPPVVSKSALESRSDPVTLTSLAMAFVSGGAIKVLIDAIRATYPNSRDSKVQYELTIEDKRLNISFSGDKLSRDQVTHELEKWDSLSNQASKM